MTLAARAVLWSWPGDPNPACLMMAVLLVLACLTHIRSYPRLGRALRSGACVSGLFRQDPQHFRRPPP